METIRRRSVLEIVASLPFSAAIASASACSREKRSRGVCHKSCTDEGVPFRFWACEDKQRGRVFREGTKLCDVNLSLSLSLSLKDRLEERRVEFDRYIGYVKAMLTIPVLNDGFLAYRHALSTGDGRGVNPPPPANYGFPPSQCMHPEHLLNLQKVTPDFKCEVRHDLLIYDQRVDKLGTLPETSSKLTPTVAK